MEGGTLCGRGALRSGDPNDHRGLIQRGSYTFPIAIAPELDAMSDEQLSRVWTFAYSLDWEAEDVGLCLVSLLEDAESLGLGPSSKPLSSGRHYSSSTSVAELGDGGTGVSSDD